MANVKITDLTAQTTVHNADLLPIIDTTDTTQSAAGTTKQIAKSALFQGVVTVTKTVAASGGDYTTIGAAIAANNAADCIIYVMPGTYVEAGAVTVTAIQNMTIIALNPAATTWTIATNNVSLTMTAGKILKISGLSIGITSGVFTISTGTDHVIENCIFNFTGAGKLTSSTARFHFIGNRVTTNTAESGGLANVNIGGTACTISNNFFTLNHGATTSAGILATGASALVMNNYFNITGTPVAPVINVQANNSSIIGNYFEFGANTSLVRGIDLNSINNTTIVGNYFSNNDGGGKIINVNTGDYTNITGNLFNACKLGVFLTTANFSTITGNTFKGTTVTATKAVDIQTLSNRNIVSANIMTTFTNGVNIVSGDTNNLISSNVINGCTTAIADAGTTTSSVNNVTT